MIPGNYAALNDKFYCKTHYESNYKKRGSYVFEDDESQAVPTQPKTESATQATVATKPEEETKKEASVSSPPTTPTESVPTSPPTSSTETVAASPPATPTEPAVVTGDATQAIVPSPTVEKVSAPVIQVTVDDDYDTVMKEQEKRTRASVSSKAREAAEKMGLDVPPDPLEDLGGEEKTEKVMERRLSVVAQRSEKSKERAEAAAKWLDKQIRKVTTN